MYLGIDLGTSGLKALLLDERQRRVAVADSPLTVSRPRPQWSEQNPEDWWTALNAASAIGSGAVNAGEGFVSLGTSGVVFEVTGSFQSAPELAVHAFAHALPARWHQMAVMLSAASAMTWATALLGRRDEAELIRTAATLTSAQRAQAPIFLPYLGGERTPHNDARAAGVLMGLRHNHDAAAVGYAVMEGVGFGLRDGLAAMHGEAVEPGGRPLCLVGGGARNDQWAALLASALGRVLLRADGAENAAALGAARLGWIADGGSEAEVCRAAEQARAFEPDRSAAAMLAERHRRFRALYRALRAQFRN